MNYYLFNFGGPVTRSACDIIAIAVPLPCPVEYHLQNGVFNISGCAVHFQYGGWSTSGWQDEGRNTSCLDYFTISVVKLAI